VTEILIGFSGDLDATAAQRLGTYRLTIAGTHGSFTARNAKVIKLRSAVYDAANDTVTLAPSKPFKLSGPVQLKVNGQPFPLRRVRHFLILSAR
jgi:hypothetical protein